MMLETDRRPTLLDFLDWKGGLNSVDRTPLSRLCRLGQLLPMVDKRLLCHALFSLPFHGVEEASRRSADDVVSWNDKICSKLRLNRWHVFLWLKSKRSPSQLTEDLEEYHSELRTVTMASSLSDASEGFKMFLKLNCLFRFFGCCGVLIRADPFPIHLAYSGSAETLNLVRKGLVSRAYHVGQSCTTAMLCFWMNPRWRNQWPP